MIFLIFLFRTCFFLGFCQKSASQVPSIDSAQLNSTLINLSNLTNLLCEICNISPALADNFIKTFAFINVSNNDVKFYAYKASNSTTQVGASNIRRYLRHRQTVVLIHGWDNSRFSNSIVVMADAYLTAGGYNVIIADWSSVAAISYCVAATSVKGVGQVIGDFIYNVSRTHVQFVPSLHLVGFSLGAHCAGFAGNTYYKRTGTKLPWITGNDPAGPLFANLGVANNMLSKDDAVFVDAIHTDSGILGTVETCGQIDFFVNCGGPIQPSCVPVLTNTTVLSAAINTVKCSHGTSCTYFASTVRNHHAYNGTLCKFCKLGIVNEPVTGSQLMGEGVNKTAKGVYCVSTP